MGARRALCQWRACQSKTPPCKARDDIGLALRFREGPGAPVRNGGGVSPWRLGAAVPCSAPCSAWATPPSRHGGYTGRPAAGRLGR